MAGAVGELSCEALWVGVLGLMRGRLLPVTNDDEGVEAQQSGCSTLVELQELHGDAAAAAAIISTSA